VIELRGIVKRYDGRFAVDGLDLDVAEGEFVVLLGPSGCGKTTTLRAINRMVDIDAGTIRVDGRDVTGVSADELRRHIGYVIQSIGLFPHMTVARNVAVVPRLLGWEHERIDVRVNELLEIVGLAPDEYAHKKPRQLSGGEQQRVGVARALAADPPILLMDEPFGALDPISRQRLQVELRELHRLLGKTIVFVTHDVEEAVVLADRIALMRDGRLVQYDTPEGLWLRPADEFVRTFFGEELSLKILSRHTVAEVSLQPATGAETARRELSSETSLRDALALMVTCCDGSLVVRGDDGRVAGLLTFDDIVRWVRGRV